MPIFLPEPAPSRPADGKGFNRLSLNAHMGAGGAQCALRPRSYATLFESYNTTRARWGGFGPCIGPAYNCGQCPVPAALSSSPEHIPFNAPRVLVRIHSTVEAGAMSTATGYHSLWVTDSPADADYRRNTQPWTWARLRAVSGWELGRRYRDEIGEGFWMHRTPWVAAPHVEVRTRSWQTHTRHAFLVTGTRAALLTCFDECRHAHGELLNVIGQHTPESADDGAGPAPWRHLRVPAKPQRGRHLSLTSTQGAVHVELRQGTARLARLTFTSRQWTPEQIHDAAAGLLEQTDR